MKRGYKILIGVVAVIVAIPVLLLLYIGSPYFSATLGTFLTHRSGRNVILEGNIETHLFQREPRIIFRNVKIGNAEWSDKPTMFEAEHIEFSIQPLELLKGRIVFPYFGIQNAHLLLEKNKDGKANWEFFQNPQASVLKKPLPSSRFDVPLLQQLDLEKVSLSYNDPAKNIYTNLKLDTASGNTTQALHLSGTGSYQKAPFTLEMNGDSVLQLRESNKPYPFILKTKIGATEASAEGTVQDPVQLKALNVVLHLKGANAADLFPITGIALPPTPPYSIEGRLNGEGNRWEMKDFKGKMGSSDLKGSVIWHADQKPPFFEGTFISDNLNMADLSGFVGAHQKPADPNRVIPDTPLDISRLRAMDADVTFHGRHVRTPNLLDDFYMKTELKDGTLVLNPLSFGIGDGKISVDAVIEGQKTPPPVTANIHFTRLSLTDLFQSVVEKYGKKNVSAGLLGGEAAIKGTGKSLQEILATSNGTVGIGMEGGQLSHLLLELVGLDLFRVSGLVLTGDNPVPINCLIGDFTVEQGIMKTREFLIDTDVTLIRGKGDVNLKDEALNLRLYVYPKKPTLLSARTPIELGGTFKHPKPGVNTAALVARGGAAALLALLAPPAALLAFIDPGLGAQSSCAGFVHEFEHSATK